MCLSEIPDLIFLSSLLVSMCKNLKNTVLDMDIYFTFPAPPLGGEMKSEHLGGNERERRKNGKKRRGKGKVRKKQENRQENAFINAFILYEPLIVLGYVVFCMGAACFC